MSATANAAKSQLPEQRLSYAVSVKKLSEVQSAIADGANNVYRILRDELYKAKKEFCNRNFDIIKELVDADKHLLDAEHTDDLVYQTIFYECTSDSNQCTALKSFSVRNVVGIASWQYSASEKLLEKIASIAAEHDDRPDVIMCVFDQVSKSKLADIKFLDYAEHVANTHNAVNMQAFITELRGEINRKQNEQ